MEALRHSRVLTTFWLFLSLLILNYSIDVPDPHSDSVKEDLSYNDIESITELVFEYCLGWEDFVPEHDEDDPDDNTGFAKKIEVTFSFATIALEVISVKPVVSSRHFFADPNSAPQNPFIPGVTKPPQA